jgi:hypothetical protein
MSLHFTYFRALTGNPSIYFQDFVHVIVSLEATLFLRLFTGAFVYIQSSFANAAISVIRAHFAVPCTPSHLSQT